MQHLPTLLNIAQAQTTEVADIDTSGLFRVFSSVSGVKCLDFVILKLLVTAKCKFKHPNTDPDICSINQLNMHMAALNYTHSGMQNLKSKD